MYKESGGLRKKKPRMEKERYEQGLTIEGFKDRKPRGEFGQRLEGVRGLTMRGEKRREGWLRI